jgi:ADP-sugar diphosphatase
MMSSAASAANPTFIDVGFSGPVPVLFNPNGYLSKGGKYYTVEQALAFVTISAAFKGWYAKTQAKFGADFKSVNILEIYPFVNETRPMGFVMVDATITTKDKTGAVVPIPGAALLRGGAVAVLMIAVSETDPSKKFVINTIQARAPGSETAYEEIPAGMIDEDKNFAGVAAKEMKEETGIVINESEFQDLGTMYPSIGGCDEFIRLYRVIKTLPEDQIARLEGLATGAAGENEVITVKVRTLENFIEALTTGEITDAKALSAYAKHVLIPPPAATGTMATEGGRRRKGRKTLKKTLKKSKRHNH